MFVDFVSVPYQVYCMHDMAYGITHYFKQCLIKRSMFVVSRLPLGYKCITIHYWTDTNGIKSVAGLNKVAIKFKTTSVTAAAGKVKTCHHSLQALVSSVVVHMYPSL